MFVKIAIVWSDSKDEKEPSVRETREITQSNTTEKAQGGKDVISGHHAISEITSVPINLLSLSMRLKHKVVIKLSPG